MGTSDSELKSAIVRVQEGHGLYAVLFLRGCFVGVRLQRGGAVGGSGRKIT
jgi:hypothetical protein